MYPDQISRKERERECASIAKMRADAAALDRIDDYGTASWFALERFAAQGDNKAQAEMQLRRCAVPRYTF